jgi:hypothetical protein
VIFDSPSTITIKTLASMTLTFMRKKIMILLEKKNYFGVNTTISLFAALLTLIILVSNISGQNKDGKPDFTGKWKAESLIKEVGEPLIHPAAAKETNEIDHKDPELKISRGYEGMDRVYELRYTIDGKEITISEGDGTSLRSKAGWSGKRLIITTQLAAGEIKETWDLDDDRKTLIITKELLNSRWKMVFKKQ